jgi:hypothetical protein
LDIHGETGIARVKPIAVPAGLRMHVDCKLDFTTRGCRAFRDELRLDPACLEERGPEDQQ